MTPISQQLRTLIRDSGLSQYRICVETGLDQAQLSKFMRRKAGLSLEIIDSIGKLLDLRLSAGKSPRREKSK